MLPDCELFFVHTPHHKLLATVFSRRAQRSNIFIHMAFLENIFGPSKEEIWRQIATDIGGEYIDGGFWKSGVLRYQHENWEMLMDTWSDGNRGPYTRLRIPFINKDGLQFRIYEKNFFSDIGKALGSQDIQIEDPRFDPKFIIQGNNVPKVKKLLRDAQLKALFDLVPGINVHVKNSNGIFSKKFPPNVDMLFFQHRGILKDKEKLQLIFRLFTTLLERLVQIDSAYQDDPGLRL